MESAFEKYKGIHPGLLLERELKKRSLKKGPFALSIGEYPQVLNEITKGKRGISAALSVKLDKTLGLESGTMFVLQAYYQVKKEEEKASKSIHPNLSIIREILFWDTDFNKIDWIRDYNAIIRRVFERGEDAEKTEILNFYGTEKVESVIGRDSLSANQLVLMPHLRPY